MCISNRFGYITRRPKTIKKIFPLHDRIYNKFGPRIFHTFIGCEFGVIHCAKFEVFTWSIYNVVTIKKYSFLVIQLAKVSLNFLVSVVYTGVHYDNENNMFQNLAATTGHRERPVVSWKVTVPFMFKFKFTIPEGRLKSARVYMSCHPVHFTSHKISLFRDNTCCLVGGSQRLSRWMIYLPSIQHITK